MKSRRELNKEHESVKRVTSEKSNGSRTFGEVPKLAEGAPLERE